MSEAELREEICALRARLRSVEAERDVAIMERNAALATVRWVELTTDEMMDLAKTGCSGCHGLGMITTSHSKRICDCLLKAMRADRKFSLSDAGRPIRQATPNEVVNAG